MWAVIVVAVAAVLHLGFHLVVCVSARASGLPRSWAVLFPIGSLGAWEDLLALNKQIESDTQSLGRGE
jgi:hypothetical protein